MPELLFNIRYMAASLDSTQLAWIVVATTLFAAWIFEAIST